MKEAYSKREVIELGKVSKHIQYAMNEVKYFDKCLHTREYSKDEYFKVNRMLRYYTDECKMLIDYAKLKFDVDLEELYNLHDLYSTTTEEEES